MELCTLSLRLQMSIMKTLPQMPIFMETKRLENLKTPGAVDPTETFGFAYSLPPWAKCFEDQRTSGYWRSLAGHLFAKLARWKSCSPQSVVVLAARGFN